MSSRTMVKLLGTQHCVALRTISRNHKSGSFCMFRSELMELETKDEVILCDGSSFAILRRNLCAATISIHISWLCNHSDTLTGRKETVVLPYGSFMAFAKAGLAEGHIANKSILSIEQGKPQPQMVFCDVERLHECLSRADVRRKLVRFLRDNFCWQGSEKICFYPDFVPYSFFFQEFRHGQPGLSGGLILHGQEDMSKAAYSIHT